MKVGRLKDGGVQHTDGGGQVHYIMNLFHIYVERTVKSGRGCGHMEVSKTL